MGKVVALGEMLLRLSPDGYYRFFQDNKFGACFGGAEANTAVSLASFGIESEYVTKLPEHAIGQAAVNSLRGFGVNTGHIVRGGDRVGIYFLEKGASQRPSVCIYDRKHSAFSEALPEEFDWNEIFKSTEWFHFTGITPALSENARQICRNALEEAKKRGITVSCDTNYRSKLWSVEKASEVMTELMSYVDVCITNPGDAKDLFGIISDKPDFELKDPYGEGAVSVAEKLRAKFGFKTVALTLRHNISASDNTFGGLLCNDGGCYFSRNYDMHIVDRVGGGDAFAAGLIYAVCKSFTPEHAVEFAVAASVLKHTVEGDFNRIDISEAEALASGDGSGRVKR